MDVSFTLWTLQDVLSKIPFDTPAASSLHLNFSDIAVPYYVKDIFRVAFLYEDELPYEACCAIYSPKNVITVVIIMKKKYENDLRAWLDGDTESITRCCLRRELYCHEACHLTAIIRAFPSDRSSKVRDDFIKKIKDKFLQSVETEEEVNSVPLVSAEESGASPSVFDNEHFRYAKDSLNYFRLFQELMLNYDKMAAAVKKLCAASSRPITFNDVAQVTLVPPSFFMLFPEKLTALKELLAEEMNKN